MGLCFLWSPGTTKGSTGSGSGFKASQMTDWEKPGIQPATQKANLGLNKFHLVSLRFVCWFYDGNIRRFNESGFMEKPESNLRPHVYKT